MAPEKKAPAKPAEEKPSRTSQLLKDLEERWRFIVGAASVIAAIAFALFVYKSFEKLGDKTAELQGSVAVLKDNHDQRKKELENLASDIKSTSDRARNLKEAITELEKRKPAEIAEMVKLLDENKDKIDLLRRLDALGQAPSLKAWCHIPGEKKEQLSMQLPSNGIAKVVRHSVGRYSVELTEPLLGDDKHVLMVTAKNPGATAVVYDETPHSFEIGLLEQSAIRTWEQADGPVDVMIFASGGRTLASPAK